MLTADEKETALSELRDRAEKLKTNIDYFDYLLQFSAKISTVEISLAGSITVFKIEMNGDDTIQKNFTQFIADSLLDLQTKQQDTDYKIQLLS